MRHNIRPTNEPGWRDIRVHVHLYFKNGKVQYTKAQLDYRVIPAPYSRLYRCVLPIYDDGFLFAYGSLRSSTPYSTPSTFYVMDVGSKLRSLSGFKKWQQHKERLFYDWPTWDVMKRRENLEFSCGKFSAYLRDDHIELRIGGCLLYTSPSPRDRTRSRMPSSA